MKRVLFLVALILALGAVPAYAHVTVSADSTEPGAYTVATFHVPTESATASTVQLVVHMPTATPFAEVLVQPVPGWTSSVTNRKLSTPITNDDGDQITEAVASVTWKAKSTADGIPPGDFNQFPVSLGPLPKSGTVTFDVDQTYSDGKVVKWNETAAPGSTVEPENPAPTITLAAAASASTSGKSSSSDTGAVILSIVALVLAAVALGLSVFNRAVGRIKA